MKLAKTQTFCLAQWERFALNRLGKAETRPFEVSAPPAAASRAAAAYRFAREIGKV